ncbi:MAG: hypothetical protein IJ764_05945 [Bacteroidales bacterium]|nr:hypothetical protein [Bacteroidales bacterium]
MEKNKMIFKILATVSCVIMAGSTLTTVFLMPAPATQRTSYLLSTLLPEIIVILIIYAALRNPQINRKYTLRRVEGRLRFVRRTQGPDPEGLRYRAYGIIILLLVVLFAVINSTVVIPLPSEAIIATSLLLTAAIVVILERCESQLDKN